MTHCACCNRDVVEAPPSRAYWGLIGTFWAFSLLFGIGAGVFTSWSFILLLAWLFFATITGTFLRGALTWSCPECGAALPAPTDTPTTHTPATHTPTTARGMRAPHPA